MQGEIDADEAASRAREGGSHGEGHRGAHGIRQRRRVFHVQMLDAPQILADEQDMQDAIMVERQIAHRLAGGIVDAQRERGGLSGHEPCR